MDQEGATGDVIHPPRFRLNHRKAASLAASAWPRRLTWAFLCQLCHVFFTKARPARGRDRPSTSPARLLRRGVIGPDERQYSAFAARGGAGDREAAPLPPEAALRAHRLRAARPRDPGHGRGRAASRGRAVRPGLGRPALVPVPALRLLAAAHPAGASRQEVPAGPGRDHAAAAGQAAARPLRPAADRRGPCDPLPGLERAGRRHLPVRQRSRRAGRGVHPHPQRPAGRRGRPDDDQQARHRARPAVPVRGQHQEPVPGRRRVRRLRRCWRASRPSGSGSPSGGRST